MNIKTKWYVYCMARKRYINIGVPEELTKLVDEIWKPSRKGFRSRAEFVIEAIREKINREKRIK